MQDSRRAAGLLLPGVSRLGSQRAQGAILAGERQAGRQAAEIREGGKAMRVYYRVICTKGGICNTKGASGTCAKCGERPTGGAWWYRFRFGGRIVHESAKTQSKTVAREAERQRRREIEEAINGLKRRKLPATLEKASREWIDLKRVTLSPRSIAIEEANLLHLRPALGGRLLNEISAVDIAKYQQSRLTKAQRPKQSTLRWERCGPSCGATGFGRTYRWM